MGTAKREKNFEENSTFQLGRIKKRTKDGKGGGRSGFSAKRITTLDGGDRITRRKNIR